MKQIPLLDVTTDERAVLLRITCTYPSAELPLGELFSCWRPGGPKAPWRDSRVWSVLGTLEARGTVERIAGATGTVLRARNGHE